MEMFLTCGLRRGDRRQPRGSFVAMRIAWATEGFAVVLFLRIGRLDAPCIEILRLFRVASLSAGINGARSASLGELVLG
jgi:hypothetical protein